MALKMSAVVKKILSMIGGSPLMQVPTSTIAGSPIAAQAGGAIGAAAGVMGMAKSAMSAAGGSIDAGLAAISSNPLAGTISSVSDRVDSLTSGNFANIGSVLPASVTSNANVASEFAAFKAAVGGVDGNGGAAAGIRKFKDHTDRLSGLKQSSDSTGE
jgi:hypothetical protein